MEPVTHFLTGACLGRSGFNRKTAYATLAAVLAVLRSKRPEKYRDSYKPEPSPPEDPDPRLDLLTKDELLQLEELLGKATHTVREANHALVGADQTGDVGAPQSGESVSE